MMIIIISHLGYNWIMRRFIENSPVEKVFQHHDNETDVYDAFVLSPTKSVRWYNWRLGQPFEDTYVDGSQHKVKHTFVEAFKHLKLL